MTRTTTGARKVARDNARRAVEPAGAGAALVDAWWASVLAGDVYQPHPVYAALKPHLDGGRLRLTGELENEADRNELVGQARERIGHGIDRVDVSHLTVASHKEKAGILHQTLVSAFPNREAAEFARAFVLKHSRVAPDHDEIVDSRHADKLHTLMPEEFIKDASRALDAGEALLILRVDETVAFRVRELLEEDTRSVWTIAVPPQLNVRSGQHG
ncbi:MAG: hypothetical protein ACYDA0_00585 [Candidatus Dormibacteraceae bacterium]